jgi:hypothetical protein
MCRLCCGADFQIKCHEGWVFVNDCSHADLWGAAEAESLYLPHSQAELKAAGLVLGDPLGQVAKHPPSYVRSAAIRNLAMLAA